MPTKYDAIIIGTGQAAPALANRLNQEGLHVAIIERDRIGGTNGDEAIHNLLAVMYAGAPYKVISRAVHIHPTVAELLPTVLQSLEPLR